jgi:hypothetical protein
MALWKVRMSIRRAPYAPMAMSRELAAQYCSLSVRDFERAVAAGELPMPFLLAGQERWNREAIETMLGCLNEAPDDWRSKQPGLNRGYEWEKHQPGLNRET